MRRDPARPLLTYYDDRSHERTELSVATFANWVAKTANLLQDDLAVAPGTQVALDLPLHWQAAVWLQACWALGLHVVSATEAGQTAAAELLVTSYDGDLAERMGTAGEVVALGLGPMGLPRRDAVAPAWATLDYDREVHGHGDRFVPVTPPDPDAPALTLATSDAGDHTWTGRELMAAVDAASLLTAGDRLLLVEPFPSSLEAVLGGLLVPLAGPGSAVLCRHLDPELLAGRVRQEGIVASVGRTLEGLLRWWTPPGDGREMS